MSNFFLFKEDKYFWNLHIKFDTFSPMSKSVYKIVHKDHWRNYQRCDSFMVKQCSLFIIKFYVLWMYIVVNAIIPNWTFHTWRGDCNNGSLGSKKINLRSSPSLLLMFFMFWVRWCVDIYVSVYNHDNNSFLTQTLKGEAEKD